MYLHVLKLSSLEIFDASEVRLCYDILLFEFVDVVSNFHHLDWFPLSLSLSLSLERERDSSFLHVLFHFFFFFIFKLRGEIDLPSLILYSAIAEVHDLVVGSKATSRERT